MDPDRVRAYLQVACAGLGFDIGEVWWTTNDNGSSSALAAVEEKHEESNALVVRDGNNKKKFRFVQLYTSKSFEDRRSMLVRPADEEENYQSKVNGARHDDDSVKKQHVLSPLLVDAISKTAQVVWAHTRKQEGLTGRSDIRLQTAVGMPVAVDGDGNMCVVVMFSPNNISSTDDAMEYLQSISRSATSSSIPSLLPAFDSSRQGLISLPHHHPSNEAIPLLSSPTMSDGVITRFVSLDDAPIGSEALSLPEVHCDHDLANAPKDCFGIPMLPSVAELEGTNNASFSNIEGNPTSDAFDEASYGVWSTIMETGDYPDSSELPDVPGVQHSFGSTQGTFQTAEISGPVYAENKPYMANERRERLEEFASAFLGVSVFDLAEVWIPIGGQSDYIGQVTSISSCDSNLAINEFRRQSEMILIRHWSGAVGRAFSSGNPVWSVNQDVFADSGRLDLFRQAKLQTALAVPVFSGRTATPSFVFCCYSFVRTGSVPFVLKFVQQALRLLWDGLDKVQPHRSVGEDLWRDVAPADLGEMAADVEMQQHFMIKKRPHASISSLGQPKDPVDSSLAETFESMDVPSGSYAVRSIYTGSSPPIGPMEAPSQEYVPTVASYQYVYESMETHIQDAIRAVGHMKPVHHHVSTNAQGSKRAHVFSPLEADHSGVFDASPEDILPDSSLQQIHHSPGTIDHHLMQLPAPLPMPRPLPLPNQLLVHPSSSSSQAAPADQPRYNRVSQDHEIQVHEGTFADRIQQPQHCQLNYAQQQELLTDTTQAAAVQQSYHSVSYSTQSPHLAPLTDNGPVPAPVASIPVDQISAAGITFPVPPSSPVNAPNGMHAEGMASVAPNPLPTQYCMAVNQTAAFPGISGGKRCRIQGCTDPAVARRPYCVQHSGNRMCEHSGCAKCAQGTTRYCIAHGGGRRCTYPGCDKGARDKFFCAAHGGGKRCKTDGCNKSAVGGSSLCTAHGGGRRCTVEGCDKSAQSSTRFCVKHGGGKKCAQDGCEKVARGRTQYCAAHGGGVRCKLAGCNRVAIGKLQLCRAHGGGARPRSRNPDPDPLLVPEPLQQIQGFADMTSV